MGKVFRAKKNLPAQNLRPSGTVSRGAGVGGTRDINWESLTHETFSKGNSVGGSFRQKDDSPGSCLLSKTGASVQESPNQQQLQETGTTMPSQ